MRIEFGAAVETFQKFVSQMEGYCVTITPEWEEFRKPEPFDAEIVGPDYDAGWYSAVLVRDWDEDEGIATGEPYSVNVDSMIIH